jgi:hypothetical protein
MTYRTTCAIHQPNLFPRLSTLAKLYAADIWIVLDDVQFNARDYQHRAWLQRPDGIRGQWLTLPVHKSFGRATRMNEVLLLDNEKTARRVAQLTHHYYGNSRHWPALRGIVQQVAKATRLSNQLVDIAELSTRLILEHMGWQGTIVRSSRFSVRSERSARLADLATALGAGEYLCGTGGAKYLDESPFAHLGITVRYVALPHAHVLHESKRISGLWWLAAASWDELQGLFWRDWAIAS